MHIIAVHIVVLTFALTMLVFVVNRHAKSHSGMTTTLLRIVSASMLCLLIALTCVHLLFVIEWVSQKSTANLVLKNGGNVSWESTVPNWLTTVLPTSLLTYFERIDSITIEGQDIDPEIMLALDNLHQLKSLVLSHARFDLRFIGGISDLNTLETLELDGTGIGDTELAKLAGMTNLQHFNISDNSRITRQCFATLKSMKSLTVLFCQGLNILMSDVTALQEQMPGTAIIAVRYSSP